MRRALALTDLLLDECGAAFLRCVQCQAFFNTYMNMVNNIRFTHAEHAGEEWLEVLELALEFPTSWAARTVAVHQEFPVFQLLSRHLASQKDLAEMRLVPPQTQAGRVRAAAAPGDSASGEGGFLGDVAAARRLSGHLAAMVQDAQRQVGKGFQLQITVNSDVIQDLCGACASARGALSGAVQRAVSGDEAETLQGVPLSDVFALIDEVDALLPQCGWVDGEPPRVSSRPGRARGGRCGPEQGPGEMPSRTIPSPGPSPRAPAGRSPRRPRRMRGPEGDEQWIVDAEACLALVEQKLGEGVPIRVEGNPRPGKPLLVLDLDSTLVDFRDFKAYGVSARGQVDGVCRPFMRKFLETARGSFDIALWSRSTREALDLKLRELGHLDATGEDAGGDALGEEPFRYIMILDRGATLDTPVRSVAGSEVVLSSVKPLRFIWERFPGNYGPHNTVHVDDVPRNFLLNPQNGLLISPWQSAGPDCDERQRQRSRQDRELEYLLQYLQGLAEDSSGSWEGRDHSRWRQDVLMSIAEKKLAQGV